MGSIKIAPSVLSADMANLKGELDKIAGADYVHFDVMDGHFTGNLTFGVDILKAVKRVNPGFGGQSFIPGTLPKLHELKAMCERHGVSPMIEVDGGISSKNIAEVVKAGANVLVAGSAVFKSEDPAAEVALLQKLGNEAAQEA